MVFFWKNQWEYQLRPRGTLDVLWAGDDKTQYVTKVSLQVVTWVWYKTHWLHRHRQCINHHMGAPHVETVRGGGAEFLTVAAVAPTEYKYMSTWWWGWHPNPGPAGAGCVLHSWSASHLAMHTGHRPRRSVTQPPTTSCFITHLPQWGTQNRSSPKMNVHPVRNTLYWPSQLGLWPVASTKEMADKDG